MHKMKKRLILIATMFFILFFTACMDDFLDRPPLDQITIDNFYSTPEELRMGTAALYNLPWFDYNDKGFFAIGDAAGGNFITNDGAYLAFSLFTVTSTSPRINEAWRSFYQVVAQSNMVIYGVNNSDSRDITEEQKNLAIAEARFMRAVAYLQLVANWGPVPIIENNLDHLDDYQLYPIVVEDVYKFAIRDLEFAAEWLLENDLPGRVTQWSAKGMLARAHLYAAGLNQNGTRDAGHLTKARNYAIEVIEESGHSLMDNYGDQYILDNNNNPESLFAFQWVDKGSGWGVQNTHQAYFAPEGRLTGVGDGWGGANGASADLQALYGWPESDNDLRRKPTFMFYGDFYPELLQDEGGYLYERKSYAGSAVKKYVIGTPEDNPGYILSFMSTPLNTPMLRLAEIYLIAAEAILGDAESTSDADALRYYNAIRTRAGLSEQNMITFDDIFREKRLELAMEGRLWHELVRWHYFEAEKARSYIANQNRGHFEWDDEERTPTELYITPSDADFRFPYPETDVVNNPLLNEEPINYNFSDE
ncbi:MAG: RagB/SusD family nutrient uptake outer membrane protein [Bacteroidia bacterium]|nr:MAG: RagB/SusD family nutrient uptake outer membrane protein [Bacteroidia bacterium]